MQSREATSSVKDSLYGINDIETLVKISQLESALAENNQILSRELSRVAREGSSPAREGSSPGREREGHC